MNIEMNRMNTTNVFSVSFVVPVFNEEREVENTARKLLGLAKKIGNSAEVIFVNDGSLDNTRKILEKIEGIKVFHHPFNLGYGAALRTGLDRAQNQWLAIVDCDGTYPIEQLEVLVNQAKEKDIQMVVGAREISFSWSQPFHKIARWVLRRMVKTLTGQMVPDLNSGMRLFKKDLYLEFCHLLPFGFSFTSTITVASLFRGYWIKYIPISYGRRTGRSHIRPVRDFFGFVVLITRLASYFDPMKFFLPISVTILLVAGLRAIRDVLLDGHFGSLAVILVFFSLQTFLTGVLADVIVRRSQMPTKPTED